MELIFERTKWFNWYFVNVDVRRHVNVECVNFSQGR